MSVARLEELIGNDALLVKKLLDRHARDPDAIHFLRNYLCDCSMDYILKYAVDPSKPILQFLRYHSNWILNENAWYYIEIAIKHNMPNVVVFHNNRIGTAKVSHWINKIILNARPGAAFFTGIEKLLDPGDFNSILHSAVEIISVYWPPEDIKSLRDAYPSVL
jgi:hypothetical protein